MFVSLPESVDVGRSVATQRRFEGSLPLSAFARLQPSLVDTQGEVAFALEFGRGAYGGSCVTVRIETGLPLLCQRTLKRFLFAVSIHQRLGIIAREEDEAALPADYEALLATDGQVKPLEVIEDELIMALPLIAVDPESEGSAVQGWDQEGGGEGQQTSPFSVLKQWKSR